MSAEVASKRGLPEATVTRLPGYLRALSDLVDKDTELVSSEELAAVVGVSSAKLRKDLSHLGSYGVRGVGYDVVRLMSEISLALGLTREWPVAIVGMGNLGRALAAYGGFGSRGFRVIAALDHDPHLYGTTVAGHTIRPMGDLEELVAEQELAIGVIATPTDAAQEVADRLVAAGVVAILNFAPTTISTPPGVSVRGVDLATELQILAFHGLRRLPQEVGL